MLFFTLGCANALTPQSGCPGTNLQFSLPELTGRRQEELLMKFCPESRTARPVGLAQNHSARLVFELWYLRPPEPALLWNLALPTSDSLVPVFCRFLFLSSVYGSLISLSPEWTVLASGQLMTGQE